MKFARQSIICFTGVLLVSSVARADDLAMAENPYSGIIERNIFALVPIPTNPPVADTPPADPPLKITPNGTMTLFGKKEVLFKVTTKPKPGQAPTDVSYVMGEGERQDDITVIKIDDQAGIITFDNHGVIQELSLVDAANQGPPAGGGGGPGMNPGGGIPMPLPSPNMPNGLMGRGLRGRPGLGAAPSAPSTVNPAAPGTAPVSFGVPPPNGAASTTSGGESSSVSDLTPEERAVLIEAQRAKWLDEGNPAAKILPPTALTKQLTGEGNAAGPPMPP